MVALYLYLQILTIIFIYKDFVNKMKFYNFNFIFYLIKDASLLKYLILIIFKISLFI